MDGLFVGGVFLVGWGWENGRMGEWEGWEGWGCTIVFMTLDYSRLLSINS
jgi:hypothetical protein